MKHSRTVYNRFFRMLSFPTMNASRTLAACAEIQRRIFIEKRHSHTFTKREKVFFLKKNGYGKEDTGLTMIFQAATVS
ncbi:MAG: hypothetical protein PHY25_05350 [Dehalococcoidales bacterium]|nr:hypothetical protein [Dehalococcoidales bacterium]